MRHPLSEAIDMGCPTPTKMVFTSAAKAAKHTRQESKLPAGRKCRLFPYKCRCGFWHLSKLRPRPYKETHGE